MLLKFFLKKLHWADWEPEYGDNRRDKRTCWPDGHLGVN
jgi:hypothetical protein